MEGNLELTLLMVMTVAAGIAAQIVAAYLKVPSIVFLLVIGIALGPSALGVLDPHLLGQGLEVIVSLSVAIILFEGGLNLTFREIKEVSGSLRNLVLLGTSITLLGGSAAAHWLGEFPWSAAFIYASLVVVTGPTVVAPLLLQVGAERRIATLLEGEGVLIDPVGAILAVVVLNIVLRGNADPVVAIGGLVSRLSLGGLIGASGGWSLSFVLKKARFLSDDLKNLTVLAGLWGFFGISQALISESGLMTAVTMGVVVRSAGLPEERLLRRFKNQLSVLAVSVLFILLSADLSIAGVLALGWPGLSAVLGLMLIVRPLNVLASTWNSDLNWRQKTFLAWVAPRGIVAASVASLFSIALTKAGINGGDAIKALVFLTIILTVFLQGLTARWVAIWLKVQATEATGAMIVGCNPLGRTVARLIQERGESVVMIDANPDYCAQAQSENLSVVLTSALDMAALSEAGVARIGSFLTVTSNPEVNSVLAQRVLEEFRPPRVLAVLPEAPVDSQLTVPTGKLSSTEVMRAFSSQVSVKDWSQYIAADEVKIGEAMLEEDAEQFQRQCVHLYALTKIGKLIPVLVIRQNYLRLARADEEWQADDRIVYLLHIPKAPAFLRDVAALQPDSTSPGPKNPIDRDEPHIATPISIAPAMRTL
ncbi:cation:proton antiporter [Altericista sp. CCNU0014]|uniref:sodium:proton antiporter n=1 Tax=Altericista sp. CCNU0014 TaxID=3082949 RepID=UPI00384DB1B2